MSERGCAIVLIGSMGAGKSSVGRRLEAVMGLPRFDMDEMIVKKFAMPILKIFDCHGEKAFRDSESELLQTFDPQRASIIVTGGGIILRDSNRERLHRLGTIVYLQADEETLFERASRRRMRPLLRTKNPRGTMQQLLRKRLPLYAEVADVTIETSGVSHDEVCDAILKQLSLTTN